MVFKYQLLSLIFIISTFVFLSGCKSEKQKEADTLESNLKVNFIANIQDTTISVDSFRLLKIDTITQSMLVLEQYEVLSKDLEELIGLYKNSTQLLSSKVDQLKLYSMLDSKTLVEIQQSEVKSQGNKGNLIKKEIDTLSKIIDVIVGNMKTADTIKAIGFQAKSFYQIRKKDKSVIRDTSFIILNIHRDIVNRKDFLSIPYNVDFNKF